MQVISPYLHMHSQYFNHQSRFSCANIFTVSFWVFFLLELFVLLLLALSSNIKSSILQENGVVTYNYMIVNLYNKNNKKYASFVYKLINDRVFF